MPLQSFILTTVSRCFAQGASSTLIGEANTNLGTKDCKRICKLYILYDSDRNPFRNLLAYTEENSPLQKSILALAARHFANTGHSFNQISTDLHPRFDQGHLDALLFKKQAIEGLSSSLSRIDMHEKDSLTAAILLLIFLDILESGIDGWKSHLRGVKSLVGLYWTLKSPVSSGTFHKDPGDTVQETRRFIATQFSLYVSVFRGSSWLVANGNRIETLGAAMSSTESMPEHAFGDEIPRQQESILRSFLGCPGFLLKAIQFFSNQRESIARLRTLDDISYNEHIRDTIAMLQLTTDFDSYEWACDFQRPSGSSATETEKAFLLSETYKVATLLYGKRVLGFIQATTPDTEVLVSQLLGMINDLKRDMNFFKCLLWPTFIVGLNCREPNQQHLVIETLSMIWDLTSCLNVISASKILREHWQRESQSDSPLQANSYIGGLGGDWLLI
ncbi:unnamed protein product [Penicillium olsonii]|nr:unnamed protein product [Penicillium olsonii]